MKAETTLKIVGRIVLRVVVFGFIGAIVFGLPWTILFANLFWNYLTTSGLFIFFGLFAGFIHLGIVGLLTWKQRDRGETLQMAVGGFFGGGLIGLILGKGAALILSLTTTFKTFDAIYSLGFIFCALIGTFYFTLHPKYAPREETIVVFSDDYLKDEHIEWK